MDAPAHGAQKKSCFGVEFILNGASLLTNAPAHDTQNKPCFGVEFILKWRLSSDECPSPWRSEQVLFWCCFL